MSTRLSPVRRAPATPATRRVAAVALAGASLVAAAASGSVFLRTARDTWTALVATGPADPADGILLVVGLVGTCLCLWLGLGLTLAALAALPGALGRVCEQLASRVAPSAVRKVVAFVLGSALTASLAPGTAIAVTAGPGYGTPRTEVVATAPAVIRTSRALALAAPDASFRFVSGPADDGDAAPPPSWSPKPQQVVVAGGETLWSIAARHLGPTARAADIDIAWRRWLAANRDVIGEDPNLIFPGQVLVAPSQPGALRSRSAGS